MFSATSNMKIFLAGLVAYKAKTDIEIGLALKDVGRKLVPNLMKSTPKLTHRAASGFIIAAVNLGSNWTGIVAGPGVNKGKSEGRYTDGTHGVGTKYIQFENLVPYIGILNDRHSTQAGFVARNLAQANAELKIRLGSAITKWW